MHAVMTGITPGLVAWRQRTGADKFDEMWEGVWHVAPAPSLFHQDFQWSLEAWLRAFWARPAGNRVFHDANLAPPGGWPKDFRVPDLVLLGPECLHIMRGVYLEGTPTAVIEIRSPNDETMEKLPFYARLGVPEVWVIDADVGLADMYVLRAGRYEKQPPMADGWLNSAATGIQLRGEAGDRIAVQIAGDEATRRLLPEM
jgi:Uma2 family endonuclease